MPGGVGYLNIAKGPAGVGGDSPRTRFYPLDGEAEDLTRFARFRRSPLPQVR
ncbi:MAG: hypothetical protein AAF411_10980 [Myxococcota bacterium]